jgi:hypothetical protein
LLWVLFGVGGDVGVLFGKTQTTGVAILWWTMYGLVVFTYDVDKVFLDWEVSKEPMKKEQKDVRLGYRPT